MLNKRTGNPIKSRASTTSNASPLPSNSPAFSRSATMGDRNIRQATKIKQAQENN